MTNIRAKALEALDTLINPYVFLVEQQKLGLAETIREALPEPKWKTMDSAPRDGTHVLVCIHAYDKPDGELLAGEAFFNDGYWYGIDSDGWDVDALFEPVRWMHLPDVPTGGES